MQVGNHSQKSEIIKCHLDTSHDPSLHTWHGNIVELQRRLLVTLLSVLFFYYPSLLTTILSLFTCYRIDRSSPTGTYPQFARVSACLMCST